MKKTILLSVIIFATNMITLAQDVSLCGKYTFQEGLYVPSNKTITFGNKASADKRLQIYTWTDLQGSSFIDYVPQLYIRANTTNAMRFDQNADVHVYNNQYIPANKYLTFGSSSNANARLRFNYSAGHSRIDYAGCLFFHNSKNTQTAMIFDRSDSGFTTLFIGETQTSNRLGLRHNEGGKRSSIFNYMGPIDIHAGTTSKVAAFHSGGLKVLGEITTNKLVTLPTITWPDYVFSKEYELPRLSDIKSHIEQHSHLPGIPTGEQVKQNGIDVGEMQAKLLQKIEELTLYTIQQQEMIDKHQETISEQKNIILEQQKMFDRINHTLEKLENQVK